MSLIEHSLIVKGSPESVFDFTQDYSQRSRWDPFPERYEFHGNASQPDVGVQLTVFANNGFQMKVRYISFQRPHTAAIEMVSGPWFIRRFAGTWHFAAAGEQQTRVTFKYNIVAAPALLAPLLQPLLNFSFSRHTRKRLHALYSFLENVTPVGF